MERNAPNRRTHYILDWDTPDGDRLQESPNHTIYRAWDAKPVPVMTVGQV
ncbi:MAG: hypothetical protein F6K21_33600 [Symploca sp. SIO2D2]|nr:hypothetical protein [Symploca sp. SIO2D2]